MHVAIIMDGNRRWAAARGLAPAEGYRRGVITLRDTVAAAADCGLSDLTVYGFSTENWKRSRAEVGMLMHLCGAFARSERAELQRLGVRVGVIGEMDLFPLHARAALRDLVRATAANRRLRLHLALNYSGRDEILRAVRSIAREVQGGRLQTAAIDDAALRAGMYAPDVADPDLLIRTGGDFRLSNFLLYQVAYTELLTLPMMWPDFTSDHFAAAVREFGLRRRRFGT